jgi:hypothetical protein
MGLAQAYDAERRALAQGVVPAAERMGPGRKRGGELALPTSQATEGELKNIITALRAPPQKPSIVASVASLVSALTAIAKVLKDAHDEHGAFKMDGFSLLLFVVGVLSVGTTLYAFLEASRKSHPFHDNAIADVERMMAEAKAMAHPDAPGGAA